MTLYGKRTNVPDAEDLVEAQKRWDEKYGGKADKSVEFSFSGEEFSSDLVIKIKGTTDQIVIEDFFYEDLNKLQAIEFADGTVLDADDIEQQTIYIKGDEDDNELVGLSTNDDIQGMEGDDWLSGEEGDDSLNGVQGDDNLYGSLRENI